MMKKKTTYKNPSIVSGLSIADIMDMDPKTFLSLDTKTLRKITGRLVSAANKRLSRMEEAGEASPAYVYIMKNFGRFSTRGKDLAQLRKEYARAVGFLRSGTSSLRGWHKSQRKAQKTLHDRGIDVDLEIMQNMWHIYEELKRVDPACANLKIKYHILEVAKARLMDGEDPEAILEDMKSHLDDIKREAKEKTFSDSSPSDFFEF